jgi:hypothetical protein
MVPGVSTRSDRISDAVPTKIVGQASSILIAVRASTKAERDGAGERRREKPCMSPQCGGVPSENRLTERSETAP